MKKLILIILLLSTNAFAQYSGNNGIVVEYYNISKPYVDVTDWNATNDSTVNSTTAIQNAIASADTHNLPVFFPPGNYTSSALTVPDGMVIIGDKATLHYLVGQTGSLLTLDSNCKIEGLTLSGGTYAYDSLTAEGNRTGITVSGRTNCEFRNITVKGFNKYGLSLSNSDFGGVFDCEFRYNYVSLYIAGGGEYQKIIGSDFRNSKYGVFVGGGNNPFNGCVFEKCVYGVYIVQGSNGAHGSFTGCEMTHNTTANLYITGMDLPEIFVSNQFYSGRIWVINSEGFGMMGCQFGTVDIIMDNADGFMMMNFVQDAVSFTELNAGTLVVKDNYNQDGTAVSWND